LNEETAYKIGRAFAVYLKENEIGKLEIVVVGHDARISSPILKRSFIEGIMDEDINVWDIGLVAVDMIYFASGHFHLPAAMITASHNPKEFNGFKLMKSNIEFFATKDLETIISEKKDILLKEKGRITEGDIKNDYLKHVLDFIDVKAIRPMRIAVDASSGAVGPILKLILGKLPLECLLINFAPDGKFPYHEPDPTKEKNITDLKNAISAGHYHFGCAFDGDGDRIIFVDEKGETVDPSIIGALIARYFLKRYSYGKIVYSAVVSKIIPDVINIYGGEAIRERVGHTFIEKRLKETDGILGIETSGHYFFKKNFYADSGIITFLVMLGILSNEKKSLSVLVSELSKYVSIPEVNFKITNPQEFIKKIAQNFEGYDIDWLDGLTVRTSNFWLNLRPSNTEPLIRLNIEAKDELVLNRVKDDLLKLIEKEKAL
ncbi:MAG: phosphomannomutase/phosphoglucomutase, partial [Candidatus Azambacteria bacterium]|nr:phosphomannomutase/phosphoglucomutase [Candidatus Azambacteria bacterium]